MTTVELVRLIGVVLRQLDLKTDHSAALRGAVPPEVRNALAKQQVKIAITDLASAFFKGSEDILALDATRHEANESPDTGVTLVDNLKCFAKTVDGLVAGPH